MPSIPQSAFEVYSQQKRNKKKSKKNKIKKSKKFEVTRAVSLELENVKKASEVDDSSEGENNRTFILLKKNVEGLANNVFEPVVSDKLSTGAVSLEKVELRKSKKKSKEKTKLTKKKTKDNNVATPGKAKSDVNAQNIKSILDAVPTPSALFEWLINPYSVEEFFSKYWEQEPLHVSRSDNRLYYGESLLTMKIIDDLLKRNNMFFGKHVDVTSYRDGVRETHNPPGRANPAAVWNFYQQGCSIRLLNPQTFHPPVHFLNSNLQGLFNSFVGANAYLTPPDSQGFAPHYDDIEAFVIQLEGRKEWKIYAPRRKEEILPRNSSKNFTEDEMEEPLTTVTLEPGDLLYFPRGFIHQACTIPGVHSLHMTISTYQRNSWADFLEKLVPAALQTAINDNEEFRAGVPLDFFDHMGVLNSESDSPRRSEILSMVSNFWKIMEGDAPIDAAVDQMRIDFQHDALPPALSPGEAGRSVFKEPSRVSEDHGIQPRKLLNLESFIRLTRPNILTMVCNSDDEEETLCVYHHMHNSMEFHGEVPQCLTIPLIQAGGIEDLVKAYPTYLSVGSLDIDESDEQLQLAQLLYDNGLVITEEPLQ